MHATDNDNGWAVLRSMPGRSGQGKAAGVVHSGANTGDSIISAYIPWLAVGHKPLPRREDEKMNCKRLFKREHAFTDGDARLCAEHAFTMFANGIEWQETLTDSYGTWEHVCSSCVASELEYLRECSKCS